MKRDYLIIKETIKKEITFGHFKVNQQLPTENELIEHFKVSRYAVRKALTELQNEHLIYKIKVVVCLSRIGTKNGKSIPVVKLSA